ncbi:MAG: alpha-hydroxy acid oxidase [Hyphomicrobium sp.]
MAAAPSPPVSLADYERLAQERLSANAWAYLSGGAADEITVRWNRERFDRIALVPRVLKPCGGGNTKVNLFGREYAHPIFIAPVAHQKLAHADGESATAMAADAQDACMVLSTLSSTLLEDVASVGRTCHWFQLYLQPLREATLLLVRRAEAAGFEVLVVTIDAPIGGVRNREQRAGFALPPKAEPVNLRGIPVKPVPALAEGASAVFDHFMAQAATWEDIAWLRSQTQLPIVLKGILATDDADAAIAAGANGIVVSNHGGRTLDTAIATIEALPEIAARVGGRIPILLDGGIRRGTDVLKAIALGASAVLVGRPIVYGLAVNGALGVSHVLRLLRDEFEIAMALTGCRAIAEIGPHLIRRQGLPQDRWPGK